MSNLNKQTRGDPKKEGRKRGIKKKEKRENRSDFRIFRHKEHRKGRDSFLKLKKKIHLYFYFRFLEWVETGSMNLY